MSKNNPPETDKFAKSTNLQYGIVEDRIPEDDICRHEENRVFITQFDDTGAYWLHAGTATGVDASIMFDSFEWVAGEYHGTLWFYRSASNQKMAVGTLRWHVAEPTEGLGLVGEWFREQIDLDEWRSDIDCPRCGESVLEFPMTSQCESLECDFFVEGHIVEEQNP